MAKLEFPRFADGCSVATSCRPSCVQRRQQIWWTLALGVVIVTMRPQWCSI